MESLSAAARLKKIRLEKALSLEEVHKKTKIQLNILKALEGDTVTSLSPVYLKSFLKIYCKFLGVDHREFLGEHKELKLPHRVVLPPKPLVADKPKRSSALAGQAEGIAKIFPRGTGITLKILRATRRNLQKAAIYIFISVFFVYGLFSLGRWFAARRHLNLGRESANLVSPKKEIKKKQPPVKAKVVSGRAKAANTPSKELPSRDKPQLSPAVIAQKDALVSKKEFTLVIRAKQDCWIDLKVDGHTAFRGILPRGRAESWKANQKMELLVGDAAAVELQVDEQVFSNLGRRRQTIKGILITRQGIRIP